MIGYLATVVVAMCAYRLRHDPSAFPWAMFMLGANLALDAVLTLQKWAGDE